MTSPPKPADLALRDVCTRHLLYCENRLKPNTLSYKTTAYRRFIAFVGGDTSFRSITKHAIDKFVDELARIISKKTANKHKTELSSLWAWANKEGLVQGNPPQQIDSYAVKKTVKYIPPSVDIAKLLNIADEGFEKDFLVCLLHTAARISEIRNMAWEDVDLPHRTVTLWTSKRRGGNSEPRKIAMSETLYELLEKLNGQRTGAEAYVFTDPKTGTAYTRTCNKIKFFMGNLCARAGVAHFSAHSLRHFMATHFDDPHRAQKVLGHKNLRTTEIYLHELGVDRKAADVFESITNAARDLAQFSARFGTPLTCASIVLAHCMQRARRKISRLSAFRLSELHAYSRYHFWASCSGTSPYSPLSDSKSQIPLFNFFARPI